MNRDFDARSKCSGTSMQVRDARIKTSSNTYLVAQNKLIHAHVRDDSRRIETWEVQIGVPVVVCHAQYVFICPLQQSEGVYMKNMKFAKITATHVRQFWCKSIHWADWSNTQRT